MNLSKARQSNHLAQAIQCLVNRRKQFLSTPPADEHWVETDRLIRFVAPILWHLNQPASKIDDSVGRKGYWTNAARFSLNNIELEKIVDRFAQAAIPVIVLKGMVLAQTLYGSAGLRAVGDIDLLVQREHFKLAIELLQAMGWRSRDGDEKRGLIDALAQRDVQDAWQIGEWTGQNKSSCAVDLHWHLVPAIWYRSLYPVNLDAVWQVAQPLDYLNLHGAWELGTEHALAYLCLHLAQHGLQPVNRFLDVDQLVRQCALLPTWDWNRFTACCLQWRIKSVVFHVLSFCQWLMGTPVPHQVLSDLDPGTGAKYRIALLIKPPDLVQDSASAIGIRYPTLVKTALADQAMDIARLLIQAVFPNRQWRNQRYGKDTWIWYHWRHMRQVIVRGD